MSFGCSCAKTLLVLDENGCKKPLAYPTQPDQVVGFDGMCIEWRSLSDVIDAMFDLSLDNCVLTFTKASGETEDFDFEPCVKSAETDTTIALDGLIITYIGEDGLPQEIDLGTLPGIGTETITTLAVNGTTLIYINEDASNPAIDLTTAVQMAETNTTLALNTSMLVFSNEDNNNPPIDLCPAVQFCETNTTLGLVGTELNFVNEDGDNPVIDLTPAVQEAETNTTLSLTGSALTFVNEDGNNPAIDLCPAVELCQTVTTLELFGTVLNFENENDSNPPLDLTGAVQAAETTTILSLTGSTLTYTNEDGNNPTIDLCPAVQDCETVTTLVDNNNGSFTFVNEAGVPVTWAAPPTDGSQTIINDAGDITVTGSGTVADPYIISFTETITTMGYVPATQTLTYINEAGVPQVADLSALLQALQVADTNTIDMNLAGTGTAADPWVISGEAQISTQAGNQITNGTDGGLYVSPQDGSQTIVTGAGDVTVTGTGVPADPYVVSFTEATTTMVYTPATQLLTYTNEAGANQVADLSALLQALVVTDTPTIDLSIGGLGTAASPWNISAIARISTQAGNQITNGTDGGLYVPVNDGSETIVNGGGDVTVTGDGTPGDPYTVSFTETTTTMVYAPGTQLLTYTNEDGTAQNADLSALLQAIQVADTNTVDMNLSGTGTTADPWIISSSVDISTQAGNTLTVGTDGALYVPTSTADGSETIVNGGGDVTVTGSGTAGDPYTVSFTETVTQMVYTPGTQQLTYTNEDGTAQNADLSALLQSLQVADTDTVDMNLAGTGTVADPWIVSAEAEISTQAGNTLTTGTDGALYVPASTADGSETIVNGAGDITVTGSGTAGDPYTVSFSETTTTMVYTPGTQVLTYTNEAGTAQVADLSALNQALTVTDGDTVDFTLSGAGTTASPWNITAEVEISTQAGNTLTLGADDALYVPASAADGSETIVNAGGDITVTGSGTTADPYIVSFTETVTTLVDNGDGTATFTNESGVPVTFDTCGPDHQITAGTAAGTVTSGPQALGCGDTLHFWSNATIDFTVTPGSARVEASIGPSANANNALVLGTDNKLYVPDETVTTMQEVLPGTITYTREDGTQDNIGLSFGVSTPQDSATQAIDINVDTLQIVGVNGITVGTNGTSQIEIDGTGVTGTNIYTDDGTLGSFRTVEGAGNSIIWNNMGAFAINGGGFGATAVTGDAGLTTQAGSIDLDATGDDITIINRTDDIAITAVAGNVGISGTTTVGINTTTGNLLLNTAAVDSGAGTATAGQVLTLIDANTGESEFADPVLSSLTDNGDNTYTHSNGATPAVTQDISVPHSSGVNAGSLVQTALGGTAPLSAPANPQAGTFHFEEYTNGALLWFYDGANWVNFDGINVPWRIADPSGDAGRLDQPQTFNGGIGVTSRIQHRGDAIIGGDIGDIPAQKLHVVGAQRIEATGTNANEIEFVRPSGAAGQTFWNLFIQKFGTPDSDVLYFAPRADNGGPQGVGEIAWAMDREGNVGNNNMLENLNGSRHVQYFLDETAGDNSTYRTTAPTTIPDPQWTGEYCIGGAAVAEKFVMDGASNVTQESSHPAWASEIFGIGANLLGYHPHSYNIATGVGQALNPIDGRSIVYDIDTGEYEVWDIQRNILDSGQDDRMMYAEYHAPLSTIGYEGERGWALWNYIYGEDGYYAKQRAERGEKYEVIEPTAAIKDQLDTFTSRKPGQKQEGIAWDISGIKTKVFQGTMAISALLATVAWM